MDFNDLIQEEDLEIQDPIPPTEEPPITEPTDPPTEEPPIEEPPAEKESEDDPSIQISTNYFEFLKDFNVLDLPEDFKFDGTPEALEKALTITKESALKKAEESLLSRLPDDFKPLLQYGLAEGKDLNAYLSTFSKEVDYESAPVESLEDQRKIVYESFKLTSKYDDEKILKMIKSLEVSGDLEDAAKEAKEDLVNFQKSRRDNFVAEQKRLQEEQAAKYEEYKTSMFESIDKTPHDSLRKNRLKQVLFSPIERGNVKSTEFNFNLESIFDTPEHLVQLAELIADYNPKIGFNFDRLKNQLKSASATEFKKNVLEKLDTTQTKVNGASTKIDSDAAKV